MKASKRKGIGWDVFSVSGGGCRTRTARDADYYEIQRIDCPESGAAPAFRSDLAAVRHVFARARAGSTGAIATLWQCCNDPLVHRVLWEGA